MDSTLSFADRLRTAIALHRADQISEAEDIYLELLREAPEDPDVLHFLGVLRFQQGVTEVAIQMVEASLARAPHYVDAWNSLGNLYLSAGRMDDAEAAYRRVLELNENHAGAWNNLALILQDRKQYQEALEAHRRVIDLIPDAPDAYYNYANTLRRTGSLEEALTVYHQALKLFPGHEGANSRAGYLLYLVGRKREAAELFQKWVEAEPENPVAHHMLAAITGEDVPDRASDDYVRRLFDGMASSFDMVLLERLNYQAPKLVADALAEVIGEPKGELDVLDAGCGTGLCAPYLRPFARALTGVDLSPGMIQKAVMRGGYDHLHIGELTAYLENSPRGFDVIASADTLVYFGALDAVSRAAAGALRPGGWFVFTVERHEEDADYVIRPHGRYTHGGNYVRRVLTEAGFEDVNLTPVVLRMEVGEEVGGHLVRARLSPDVSEG